MASKQDFQNYITVDSKQTVEDVWKLVNGSVFSGHCQDESLIHIDPLEDYSVLLDRLLELGFETVRFSDCDFTKPLDPDRKVCVIRHDVDIDVVSALRTAQIEAEKGVRSSVSYTHLTLPTKA